MIRWALWFELTVRSGILLGSAALLLEFCRTASAAFRHRLLMLAAGSLLLLPVLTAILPSFPITLFAAPRSTASVSAETLAVLRGQTLPSRTIEWDAWIWLTGAVLALLPLAAGLLSTRRLLATAKPVKDGEWIGLLHALYRSSWRRPKLLLADLPAPVTCGIWRPRILLPLSALEWSGDRRKAVLLHETAHIRRWDVASQLALHVIAALWWFQPLVWMLRRKARYQSELACDAEAIRGDLRASVYAAELLGIARSLGKARPFSSAAISMVPKKGLEHRLHALLNPHIPLSGLKIWTTLCVLGAATVAGSTLTIAQNNLSGTGGSSMKRSLFSGLFAAAGLSAATITGSIFDASGAAIGDAKLVLYSPDTGLRVEGFSAPDGRFNLEEAVTPGQYILRVEKPGYHALLREFDIKSDSRIMRGLVMTSGAVAQQGGAAAKTVPLPQATPGARPSRIRVGGQLEQANLVTKVNPTYPAAAKSSHTQGTVELEAVISREGVPLEIRVISSPSDDLSQSALEGVRQWRYKPVLLNGEPIEVVTEVIVNYTLTE